MPVTIQRKPPENRTGRPRGAKDSLPRASFKTLRKLSELQDIVFNRAKEMNGARADLAQLIGAWDKLEERKRILKGVPTPGSLKPESPKPKRKLVPFSVLRDDTPNPNLSSTSTSEQADSSTGPGQS